jgi:maltose alpha-D-glucosyltransferase / alpha-amylase
VRPYFGDGDEFHMAFHFPLMPRIFMAVRQGIRKPIVEIIQRTPPIPEDCQWCMFLRNHDELTLEMVTDEERDYMYQEYAADPRMRINLGIRRRLAPLMDNDRRKIELLNSILFTMPGSPIIYYGDEMAMGDNVFLGDRDGVRTPMQWSPDRNAGFSRAEPQRLYLPPVTDSVYGFQSINTEAQQKSPFSLLNWMKRLIQVRKQHRAFGRGSIEFLEPENPHVLAYIREYEDDVILVVHNMSGAPQAVRLDLSRFSGRTPVELLGQTAFLPVDDSPYALTLSPYGFFWFGLRPVRSAEEDELYLPAEWAEREMEIFESTRTVAAMISGLPHDWLQRQRWFRGKAREVSAVRLFDRAVLRPDAGDHLLLVTVEVVYREGEPELYLLPLGFRPPAGSDGDFEPVLVFAGESGEVRVYESLLDRHTSLALLEAIERERDLTSSTGTFRARRTAALDGIHGSRTPVRRIQSEQSNTSIVFGNSLILKLFRKLEYGVNPDLEITRFLSEHSDFRAIPALAGWIEYASSTGEEASVAGLFEFVPNKGDAWSYTLRALHRFFTSAARSAADPSSTSGRESLRRMAGDFAQSARRLGTVTGELHAALASAGADQPAFLPEPIGEDDVRQWTDEFQRHASGILGDVGRRLESIPGSFPAHILNDVAAVVRQTSEIRGRMADVAILEEGNLLKTRFHGDYHLGQVLRAEDAGPGDPREWIILDFEGEPARPLSERRVKQSPLRDVAGMLRSFNYAVHMALAKEDRGAATSSVTLEQWGAAWEREIRNLFLDAYLEAVAGKRIVPDDPALMRRALAVFELEKAIYELGYELNNRPDWLWVPVQGIRTILGS